MRHGILDKLQLLRGRLRQPETYSGLVLLLMGLLLSRWPLGEQLAPLGLALLFACERTGRRSVLVLSGILLWGVLAPDPRWGVLLAAVLFFLLSRLLRRMLHGVPPAARLILFLLCQLAATPFFITGEGGDWAYAGLSLLLSAAAGYVFSAALRALRSLTRRRVLAERELWSLALSAGLVAAGLWDACFFGLSLPVALLLFCCGALVLALGAQGAVAGAIAVFAYGALTKMDPSSLAALLGALALGVFARRWGKTGVLLSCGTAILVSGCLLAEGTQLLNIQTALVGALPLLFLSREVLRRLGAILDEGNKRGAGAALAAGRMRCYAAETLTDSARTLKELSALFAPDASPPRDDRQLQWTIHGANRVCRDCVSRVLCWADPSAMHDALLKAVRAYGKGETVTPQPPIDADCRYFSQLIASAYLAFDQAEAQAAREKRGTAQFAFALRQLDGLGELLLRRADALLAERWQDDRVEQALLCAFERSGVPLCGVDVQYPDGQLLLRLRLPRDDANTPRTLKGLAERTLKTPLRVVEERQTEEGGELLLEEERAFRVEMALAALPESNTQVSGDSYGSCGLQNGGMLYVLSDGMGSGERARRESKAAVELLLELTRLGLPDALIYENLNRLLLRRGGAEMYATLDSLRIDLATGNGVLTKFGAPPSYLLRMGRLTRLCGEALPCGIVDEAKPSCLKLKLQQQDRLVLCSDGVSDALGALIEPALTGLAARPRAELAEALLLTAKRHGASDDMTVMVVEIA